MPEIVGLGENALVKGDPRQLTVDKARRRQRIGCPHIDDLGARLRAPFGAGSHAGPPDPLPHMAGGGADSTAARGPMSCAGLSIGGPDRSEEHTSKLQSLAYLVCRLLL